MKWRLGLVAVVAVAVLGGLVPHVVTGAESAGVTMAQAVESPLTSPTSCADATCGKGAPTPAAPSLAIALVAVLGGLAVAAAAAALIRRRPAEVSALPSGRRDRLFHPPQFS
jgi:ABC-type Fe3+ transport system permease subunit